MPTSEDPYFKLDSEMFTKARGSHGDPAGIHLPSHASHRLQYCLGPSPGRAWKEASELGLGG